jgi:transglutaminase-like putative cysteine protease
MPSILQRVASVVYIPPSRNIGKPNPVEALRRMPLDDIRLTPRPRVPRVHYPAIPPGQMARPMPIGRVTSLPSGDAGTAKTVGVMRKMIKDGSKSLPIRELAANIAMPHPTDRGKIAAVFDFMKQKMKYVRDPLHQEMLAGADYHYATLGTQGSARGDCDDHTIMLGSMLESIGYPTRIATVRMKPGSGGFDHVYLEVNDRKSWIPLDASNKKREAGEAPPHNRIRRW